MRVGALISRHLLKEKGSGGSVPPEWLPPDRIRSLRSQRRTEIDRNQGFGSTSVRMNPLELAALVVLFAFAEPSPPPVPTPSLSAEQNQRLSPSQTPDSNPTQQPRIGTDKNDESEEGHTSKSGNDSPADWIPFLTFAITIATIIQALIAGIQAYSMRLTRRSYEKGERAALWVEEWNFRDVFEGEKPQVTVTHKLFNTGRTPAEVYAQSWIMLDDFKSDADLPVEPPYQGGDVPVHFSIPAGEHYFRTMGFNRPELNNLAEVRRNERSLYLFGYVRYRDVFGHKHVLRIGVKYSPRLLNIAAITDRPNYNIDT